MCALVSVWAASACSAPTIPLPDGDLTQHRSGSRLRARVVRSGDTRALLQFVDTALDTDCAFTTVGGDLICAPARRGELMYFDAGCDRPFVVAGGLEPGLITTDGGVFRVGERVAPPRAWVNWDGACRPAPPRDGWSIAEPMPASAFVSGALREVDPPDARLTRLGYLGADGAWAPMGLWDRALANRCAASEAAGAMRCAPDSAPLVRDRTCRDDRVVARAEVGAVVLVGEGAATSCEFRPDHLRRLEGYAEDQHFGSFRDGQCVPGFVGNVGHAVFTVSEPMSLAELAPVTRTASGAGAVRVTGASTPDGRFAPRVFRGPTSHLPSLETSEGTYCTLVKVAGVVRCAPAAFTSPGLAFADSACTRAVAWASFGERVAAVGATSVGEVFEADVLHGLGERVQGPVFSLVTGECAPVVGSECWTYRELLGPIAQLDPGIAPPVTLEVE